MTDVEEIKERLDVAEVVGAYVQLKQAGRNLKAPCPFHHEKTASFMVSPEKGIWHCFGCGEGGDIFKFVMKYEGLDFRAALELLARKAGIELKARSEVDAKAKQEQERLFEATKLAVKYFQASLIKNPDALEYALKRRQLNKQAITDFQIGYAPDDWNALSSFLNKKHYNNLDLLKAGLVKQKEGRSTVYDAFRGRLMFPICDITGRPVGFTGRVLDDDQEPKYLNTTQTPLYDKSRVIFGLHLAKEAIRTTREVVIVEGNMDVVASHQAGVKQVVATSGTALTKDQLKSFRNISAEVTIKLAFDMDKAGRAAIQKIIPLAQEIGIDVHVIELVAAKDPDELIKKDVNLWKDAISNSKEVREYFRDKYLSEYDLKSPLQRIKYAQELGAIVSLYFKDMHSADDDFGQLVYIRQISEDTGLDERAVKKAILGATTDTPQVTNAAKAVYQSSPQALKSKPAKRLVEESLLAVNLAYPEVRLSLDDLTPAHFSDVDHQEIVETLQRLQTDKLDDIAEALPNHADYVKILVLRGEESYGSFAPADRSLEAFELVRRLQIATNKDTKAKLNRKLREAQDNGDTQLVRQLLSQYQALVSDDS